MVESLCKCHWWTCARWYSGSLNTVEPPNKGQIGISAIVLYLEAVPFWEVHYFHPQNLSLKCILDLKCVSIHCSLPKVDNNLFSRAVPEDNQCISSFTVNLS